MTVLDLIKSAMRKIGALAEGEVPTADQASESREALNLILEEWEDDPTIALSQQQTFSATAGTYSYAIGTGQTWNGSKPIKITEAYYTLSGIDQPLELITEEEYMRIMDKDSSGSPTRLFYKPSNSTGTVYLYPSPSENCTVTILGQKPFTQYSSNATLIDLPAGYKSALVFNLAMEIHPEYEGTNMPQWLITRAKETKASIMRSNLKKPIPLEFDPILTGITGRFNINNGS